MSGEITLWSSQQPIVLDTLAREGVYRVRRAFVGQKYGPSGWNFQMAYGFFVREAGKRLPPPPGAESPVWCFLDRKWVDVPAGASLLRIVPPRTQVLLFDLRRWNRILNLEYLPSGPEDAAAFARELERQGVSNPLDLFRTPYYPQLRRRVEESWKGLFQDPEHLEPAYTQAALWELRPEWVEVQSQ